jgi:hypothetical protein
MDAIESYKKDGAEAAMVDKKDGEKVEEGDPKELKADSLYDQHQARKVTDAQRDELSVIQADAEKVYSAHGNSAPRPMMNELPHEYRRRVSSQLTVERCRLKATCS